MKNKINLVFFLVLTVIAAALYNGCAPLKIARNADTAIKDRNVQVSDDEFEFWKAEAKDGKDNQERAKGAFWAGQYHYNKKNFVDAVKYFEFNEKYYQDIDWGFLSIIKLYDINILQSDRDKANARLKNLLEKRHQFSQFEGLVTDRLNETVSVMSREELKKLYAGHFHKMMDEYALYYLAKMDLADKNFDDFYSHANAFLVEFRDSKFYQEITDSYKAAVKYKPMTANKIGVIIPLSGKSMDVGALVKSGLELALMEYNENKPAAAALSLVYIDEENPKLEADVTKAIETQGVTAFIGPLYSKTVKTLSPIMDKYNTALLSPTAAQPDLTGKSPYFFRNCATAKGQAYATARYIIENTSYKNLATFYSDNAYGKILNDSFAEKFKSAGGSIVRQVAYDPKVNDFQEQMVLLGGINTILLKEKRANEKMKLDEQMEDAGKRILAKAFDYMKIVPPDDNAIPKPTPDPAMKKLNICMVHLSPRGDNVRRFMIDDDMTKKLSYTFAKSSASNVIKQKTIDDAMSAMGVEAEDLDREIALSIATKQGADVLVWGRIVEESTNTIYANFMPEVVADSKGNTSIVYNFTEDDYFKFKITLQAISVADETVLDEVSLEYRKVKDPKKNPITIDALYIPATDRKMVLIKDQLMFYDFDLPVFGSSAMSSAYMDTFKENVLGTIYPIEFYAQDTDPAVQNFVKKYKDRYANTPEAIAATSYDAMKIACSVLDLDVTSRENFRNVLALIRNYPGITGMFSFDASGDSVKEYYMMKFGKDKPEFLKKVTGE
jgi:ABC-type branched-subunit amino acid transport system substrate-binding protein